MRAVICLFFVVLVGLLKTFAQSDFPIRDGAKEGYLANGIKYYALSTPWIKGKYALGMVVKTGSLYETKDEVGVAHFLEHLVSTSVPGYDRKKSLELVYNAGLNLFEDWQAFTSEVKTVYNYTYPKENLDTEQQLVAYLRGVLGEMEFTQQEVDIERPAILAETNTSFSSGGLSNLRGGYFEHHTILGDSTQISAISPATVRGFYRKWYRPENIALVMIGDASAEELAQKLILHFSDAKCIVDSVLPPAFLPIDQHNTSLYSSSEVEVDKRKGYVGRLIYRFPLFDLSKRSELRAAIATEMIADLLKGMLDGYEADYDVSSVISANMPRSSVLNVKLNFADTIAFKDRLHEIGNAISYLRFGTVDSTFLQSLWKARPSVYKSKIKVPESANTSTILASIYSNFLGNFPISDPDSFAQALDNEALLLTSADIRQAAELVFMQSRSLLAGLPDYGADFEARMVQSFDNYCSQENVSQTYQLPSERNKFAPRSILEAKPLSEAKPSFSEEMLQSNTILPNGMHAYVLKNGLEVIWDSKVNRNYIVVETNAGIALLDETERPFVSQFKELRLPLPHGVSAKDMNSLKNSWGSPSVTLKVGQHRTTMQTGLTSHNEMFVGQYIASIYQSFTIDDASYEKGCDTYQKQAAKSTSSPEAKSMALKKEELEDRLNSLLDPKKTRVFIQGQVNIEQIMAYLSEISPKIQQGLKPQQKVDILEEDKINLTDEPKGRTFLVNRITTQAVEAVDLKRYLLNGMLEEYMSRMLLLRIRNEKGLIYTWGTTPSYGVDPSPYVSLSLRFRVIPELLNNALTEFNKLCAEVAENGVPESSLAGLKRREWNRYVDFYNNPEKSMGFVSLQINCTGHVWSNTEIRQAIDAISMDELNTYVKQYMALPAELKTY